MNFEPQKFFVGLIDFFSTLLPGAVLTLLAKDWWGPLFQGNAYSGLKGAGGWVVFLFASYLLGHFDFSSVRKGCEKVRHSNGYFATFAFFCTRQTRHHSGNCTLGSR